MLNSTNLYQETVAIHLGIALQGQLEVLCSRGFVPTRVHVDPQSAFQSLTTQFENVMIDIAGTTDYVPKADARIR